MFANFAPVVDTWAWRGRSGAAYRHYVYAIGAKPAARNAVYVLCDVDETGRYRALYIGETGADEEGRSAPPSRALLAGATHIHLNFDGATAQERCAIVADLRAELTPQALDIRTAV